MAQTFVNVLLHANGQSASELESLRLRIVVGLQLLVQQAARDVRHQARVWAEMPKSGVQYAQYLTRSSAPGEVPARQSGALLASITERYSEGGLRVTMGPTVDYALYLHQGLGGAENARPILEPAHQWASDIFRARIQILLNTGRVV